jgi:hypothetical protein
MQYRILKPVGYSGRREKGEIVEAPEGTFSPDEAEIVKDNPIEEQSAAPVSQGGDENAEAQQPAGDTPIEEQSVDQLKESAKARGLPISGSKAELVDRINLYDENAEAQQ